MTVILNRPPNLKSNVIANLIGEGALANESKHFQLYNAHSGVNNLPSSLTINGTTVAPTHIYYGGDADNTDWTAQTGETLTKTAGTALLNQGSPYHGGSSDDSVNGNASAYYQAAAGAFNNISTNDIFMAGIFKSGATGYLSYKKDAVGAGNAGWYLYNLGNRLALVMDDGVNNTVVYSSTMLVAGEWYFYSLYVDKSDAAITGSSIMINGATVGTGVDFSSVGDVDSTNNFSLLATNAGSGTLSGNVAYSAMYQAAGLFPGGAGNTTAFAAVSAELYQRLTRTMPDFASGTRNPTVATRAFGAYSEKLEPGRATSKLYLMGDNQIRNCSRLSKSGEYFEGVHLEPQVQNLAIQSGDASTTWTLLDAGDTFDLNAIAGPDGAAVMDGFIADATDGIHGITQDVTMTAVSTAISCYAKKGNQTFICIEDAFFANGKAFFDVDNEVVGATPGAGIDALYIQPGKYNDTVRCIAIVTGTAAVHTVNFKVATADNDDTFAGDGAATNAYMWGFQIECNGLGKATSYIPTVLAAATRLKDTLTYAGGSNLGGKDIGQGTLVMDVLFDDYDLVPFSYLLTVSDGGAATDIIAAIVNPTGDAFYCATAATAGNAGSAATVGDITDGEIHEVKTSYKTNRLVSGFDGINGAIDATVDIPNDLDTIAVGQRSNGFQQPACLIRNLRIYSDPDVEV